MASNPEIRGLERELGQFLNKQLQQICGTIGLRTSGVKAELQNRIKNGKQFPPPKLESVALLRQCDYLHLHKTCHIILHLKHFK